MEITQRDYFEIIHSVGYPAIKEADLEFSRSDIESYMIYPAIREYFMWFPIVEYQSLQVVNTFDVPFPEDENIFGVVDVRVNSSIGGGGDKTASPFMNELFINNTGSSGGRYGTPYDYGMTATRYTQKSYADASRNYLRARNIIVDEQNRRVSGYTTISGELIISWAKTSENFSDIPFRRKSEVLKLAKANTMRAFGYLRGQLDTDTGVDFNTNEMVSRADNLEEEVIEKWKRFTKVAVIRG